MACSRCLLCVYFIFKKYKYIYGILPLPFMGILYFLNEAGMLMPEFYFRWIWRAFAIILLKEGLLWMLVFMRRRGICGSGSGYFICRTGP